MGRDKEKERFEQLWLRERPRIESLHIRLTGSKDQAEDLTQETGLRAYLMFGQYRGGSSFGTWIYRIAMNLFLRYRERPSFSSSFSITESLASKSEESTVDQRIILQDALYHLPDDLRATLVLRVYEGLSYKEISKMLSIPIGTVMSRLYSARERLRKELCQDEM